jgi:hypothetical protein
MSGAPLMEAALRWLAEHTPGAELPRLMDAPVPLLRHRSAAWVAGESACRPGLVPESR